MTPIVRSWEKKKKSELYYIGKTKRHPIQVRILEHFDGTGQHSSDKILLEFFECGFSIEYSELKLDERSSQLDYDYEQGFIRTYLKEGKTLLNEKVSWNFSIDRRVKSTVGPVNKLF